MSDKASLLRELRIDRTDGDPRKGMPRLLVVVLAAVVLALVGMAYFFSADRPKEIPVRAQPPSESPVPGRHIDKSILEASGYVVARRQATVSAKITGKLVEIVVQEGERVRAGQIIARLDDTNTRASLELAQANLWAAKLAFQDAEPIFRRNEKIFAAGASSSQALDTARAAYHTADANFRIAGRAVEVAQRNEDDTIIRSPFDGVVTDKAANEGEIVSPVSAGGGFTRTGICTIVDMNTLEVDVDIAEEFVDRIHAGAPAEITLDAYSQLKFPAFVIALVPTADRAKGTVKIRVGFKSLDSRILPDMSAKVTFKGTVQSSGQLPGGNAGALGHASQGQY